MKSKDDTINGKQPDKKFIVIKKGGYRQIKLKESSLQYSPVIRRIEEEIELMINDLNKQIKTTLESDNIKVLIPMKMKMKMKMKIKMIKRQSPLSLHLLVSTHLTD